MHLFAQKLSWRTWQAYWVNAIKMRAIRLLQKTPAGELFLLRMYFLAENTTVCGIHENLMQLPMPAWLRRSMEAHLREEGQHIQLFTQAIQVRGGRVPLQPTLDIISAYKLRKWSKIAEKFIPQFQSGALVPAYSIGECAEQMAMRVLRRHLQVIPPNHTLYPLLSRVLADETRHAQMCNENLAQLVLPTERTHFESLMQQVRRVDVSWGILTALLLYAAAVYYFLRALMRSNEHESFE